MNDKAPPQIFDRALLRGRLDRALRKAPAEFLLARAVEDLLDRLATTKREFARVLDLGTPTPLLTRAFAARVPKTLLRAAPTQASIGDGAWDARVVDMEALPFRPESFDLIASALALQFVNDLPGALIQIRRALAADGLFIACVIGGQSLNELRTSLTAAEVELTGGASPRVAPFVDLRDLGALLQRAGFALPVTDTEAITVRYDNLFGLMRDLRAMGATNALVERSRKALRRGVLLRAAEIYAEKFSDPDGRVRATFELVWLSGWAAA